MNNCNCKYCKEIQDEIKRNSNDNDKIKEILINYTIKHKKDKTVCCEPIIYLYHKFYPDNVETSIIKIYDLKFYIEIYENISNVKLRPEIKYKMMCLSLYFRNIDIFKNNNIFSNVSITFECEKYSELYKICKDNFIEDLRNISDINISYNNKYRYHDILITVRSDNGNICQIGCEYNEPHHTDEYDSNRRLTSKIPLVSLHIRKQDDRKKISLETHFKKILEDILYKTCSLTNNNTFIAKLILYNENNDDMNDSLSLLIDCQNDNYFRFQSIIRLFKFDYDDQDDLKSFLIENEIMNDDENDDENKVSYYTDNDNNYYLDKEQFKMLMKLLNDELSGNWKNILNIYIDSLDALLRASGKINKMEKNNRIDAKNIVGFIHDITFKAINELFEKKEKETKEIECYKDLLIKLNHVNRTSKKQLPYILFDKDEKIKEKELNILKILLGSDYMTKIKKTIDSLNNDNKFKIILKYEDDNVIPIQINNARIDYELLRRHHFKT